MSPINLTVNGKVLQVEDLPETPLLWVLRDSLYLTGTKFGCGAGLCGACTAHLDGEAIRTCITPLSAVVGKKITTIEGLSRDGKHPIQRAWINEKVSQCGYCQAGQIMAVAALLAKDPLPNDAAIERAMSGNLCRCGTYLRVRRAIHRAARSMKPDEHRYDHQ